MVGPQAPGTRQGAPSWIEQGSGSRGTQAATAEPLQLPQIVHAAATFDLGKYGDLQTYPCIFPAAQDELAIVRPTKAVRTFLLIVNSLVIPNVLTVNFDTPATPGSGIMIPAGGNLFLDYFVPQGDVHVYSPIPGTIQCFYCHVNVQDATRIFQALSG